MSFTVQNDRLLFDSLNEECTYRNEKGAAAIVLGMAEAEKNSPSKIVTMDFFDTTHANSYGLGFLVKAVTKHHGRLVYTRCPSWLVNVFSLVGPQLLRNASIESVVAPFLDPSTGKSENIVLSLTKDIKATKSTQRVSLRPQIHDGIVLQPEFEPQVYFGFMLD